MMSPIYFLLPLLAIALLSAPLVHIGVKSLTGTAARRNLIWNLCGFAGFVLLIVLMPLGGFAFAAPEPVQPISGVPIEPISSAASDGMKYLGAALSTGLASLGAGIAVGNAAPAAIGACSEDPKAFGRAMIFVVMGEGIAIYGLIISFLILFL